jgi:glycosyltransferase involved in cell wall biosynthesis
MKPLHRVRFFLTEYAPWLLPLAHFLLHAVRLAPFKVYGLPSMGNNSHRDLLQDAISEKRILSKSAQPHLLLYTGSLSSGGAERQWCYLANELASRGYSVTLVAVYLSGSNGHYMPLVHKNVRLLGLDSMRIPANIASTAPSVLPYHLCVTYLAFSFLQPTHVLCQLDHTNIIGSAAALLVRAEKILMSFRNVNPSHFPYIHAEWMLSHYKQLIASSRIVLTGNSQKGNDDYAQWLGIESSAIATIHNAVHLPDEHQLACREALRSQLGIPTGKMVVLGVFRLAKEKNFKLFLDVVRELHAQIPELLVLHAGEGPYEKEVCKLIKRYNLHDVVRLLGRREDVENLMLCADLLLLTSDNEGLPNVVLEAQAACLPVVATRVGGIPEAVQENKTALLAPKGDKGGLVKYCMMLLENSALRQSMGRAGREFIQKNFSHAALGDKVLDIMGLPRKSEQLVPHEPLSLKGGLPIADTIAWVGLKKYFSEHHEPVVFFSKHYSITENTILPDGSVWVCPEGVQMTGNNGINFDWHLASDWTPLKENIPQCRKALFLDGTCCDPCVRDGLNQCGFEHILFRDYGNLYLIPTVHPSLIRRLWMLASSFFRRKA